MRVDWWAEIASSHNGDPDRAVALVRAAAAAGFTTAKIPLWHPDELFRPGALPPERLAALRAGHLSSAGVALAVEAAREAGLRVAVSVHSLERVGEAVALARTIKVGSYEMGHHHLLLAVAVHPVALVVSTGLATAEEVEAARAVVGRHRARWLHCVSEYPPRYAALERISRLGLDGYSDHTCNVAAVFRAWHYHRARIVELHIDLDDRAGAETSRGHVWRLDDAREAIRVEAIEAELGEGGAHVDALDEAERRWRASPEDGMRPCE